MKHLAVIPARAGSVGLPGKNRVFFDNTADFLDGVPWFDGVLVSTDDPAIKEKARARSYAVYDRPAELAGPAVPIKAVFEDLVSAGGIAGDTILWLFYLPVLHKNRDDFEAAKPVIERPGLRSLCSFVPARTHPYNCWRHDPETGKISQYVANDVYRRQDMPPAWRHYHYICCFEARELANLNSELLNEDTYPILLDEATARALIEIDTPEDLERWQHHIAGTRGS